MDPTEPAKIVASSTDFDAQLARIDGDNIAAIMFVFGTGADVLAVKSCCEDLADDECDVAWCSDPSVLTPQQSARYAKAVAVAVGQAKTVADPTLSAKTGQMNFFVTRAFANAQNQEPLEGGGK